MTDAPYTYTETEFLLTPLREGRPERRITVYNARTISTHAPAGGATQHDQHETRVERISTHAPAGGATPVGSSRLYSKWISTHAPAGGATNKIFRFVDILLAISTHAPAGGATRRY